MGVITEYLNQRKEKWLKNNIKANMSDLIVTELTKEAEGKFSIEKWVTDAAKRAKQLSLASHVCKFSHPDSKASPVISMCHFKNDGYLHSGNVEYELDAFGNAAAMDVFEFLMIKMDDGVKVIEHLENDSEKIRQELNFSKGKYEQIKADFLEIKKNNHEMKSDERVKQVYFPIGEKYHLLSLMTASGILRVLRDRINAMSEKARGAKDKNNEYYGKNYDKIYDLTEIGFGGSKARNISVFNHYNIGRAYLLSSNPPTILEREVTRPRQDFFYNTLQIKKFRDDFQYLHKLFECDRNNLAIRNTIKQTLNGIVDHVMTTVYKLRETETGWSEIDTYCKLPLAQKIWLDDIYAELREKNNEWLTEISLSFARWIISTYEKNLKGDSITLGDGEMIFLQSQVEGALLQNKESLE